jgi:hypothetical protein
VRHLQIIHLLHVVNFNVSPMFSRFPHSESIDNSHLKLREYGAVVLMEKSCSYCEESQKNRLFAFSVFASMFAIGAVYVIYQRNS